MTKDEILCEGIRLMRIETKNQMDKLQIRLNDLQEMCPHTNATETYKSSSGNYDPSMDREWYDYYCPDCGKKWTETV